MGDRRGHECDKAADENQDKDETANQGMGFVHKANERV
jgi:hypothetical protein